MLKKTLFYSLVSCLSRHPLLTFIGDGKLQAQSRQPKGNHLTHTWVCKCSLPPNVTKIALKNSGLVLKERPSQIHFEDREISLNLFLVLHPTEDICQGWM